MLASKLVICMALTLFFSIVSGIKNSHDLRHTNRKMLQEHDSATFSVSSNDFAWIA